ncbi:unnamed protein product, partial [Rotaria socialis]
LPQNRLQTGATLLLTSITFRWTVNRSLVSRYCPSQAKQILAHKNIF